MMSVLVVARQHYDAVDDTLNGKRKIRKDVFVHLYGFQTIARMSVLAIREPKGYTICKNPYGEKGLVSPERFQVFMDQATEFYD
jgi:hypothetical protein